MHGDDIKILLVEDSASDADLLRESLQQASKARFEFVHVDHLNDAITRLRNQKFDVALADLSLPDSKGADTYRRLRAAAPHLPIVVLTGNDDENLGVEAVRETVQDYLVKGHADGRQIVRSIRYAIERKQTEEALRAAREELELRVRWRTADLHKANKLLRAEMAKREKLQAQLLSTTEREQKRIGEDLHDGLCQLLTGARFHNAMLGQQLRTTQPDCARETDAIETLLKDAVENARDLSYGLNPLAPDARGLMTALQQLADRMQTANGPRCTCNIPQPVGISDHAVASQLYRIAQEAVQNALKHAGAKKITIELKRRNGGVTLSVADDGVGMKRTGARPRGMGLSNMSRRARLIGGTLEIKNADGGGIAVTCRLPVAEK